MWSHCPADTRDASSMWICAFSDCECWQSGLQGNRRNRSFADRRPCMCWTGNQAHWLCRGPCRSRARRQSMWHFAIAIATHDEQTRFYWERSFNAQNKQTIILILKYCIQYSNVGLWWGTEYDPRKKSEFFSFHLKIRKNLYSISKHLQINYQLYRPIDIYWVNLQVY